ncbi:MAG: iron ABC transporter permease [Chloroflexales bacterium]|nr:iron ABC transporter permease [Chloroflexales bacterium]
MDQHRVAITMDVRQNTYPSSATGRAARVQSVAFLIIRRSGFLIPIAFLAFFFLYPLAVVFQFSFAEGAQGILALLREGYYLRVFWFTVWQALLSTVLTLALALPAAYVFARYEFPGKALLRAISTAPFVMPTVVVAAAFSALLGPRGLLNSWLQNVFSLDQPPIQIQNTLAIILLAHVFYNYTIVLRLVGGFWSNLDTRLEQAAAVLGANRWRVLVEITLPLIFPALGAAALLIFIFTFTSFGVIIILGGPRFATVEVEIYRQTAQLLQLDIAAALSLVQLGCTLLFTLFYTRLAARSAVPLDLRPRHGIQRRLLTWRARTLAAVNILVLLLLLGAPLLALALRSVTVAGRDASGYTLEYYAALTENRTGSIFYVPPLTALTNSLIFAGLTALLALLIGGLAAYLLAEQETRSQRRQTGSRPASLVASLLDTLFTLPLGTSPVTLGLGLLLGFSVPLLAGLRASPLLIPVAHTLVALPFVVRVLLPVLRGLDPRLREAAAVLGAAPGRVWCEVDLPLIFPALLTGVVFAFTVSLGEFGATLIIARPEYPTLPIVIYRLLGQPGAINYGQALALSTILMLTTAVSFLLLEKVRYRDIGEF